MADVPKLTDLYAETLREAEAGDPTAWADLGDALLYGMGVEQDQEKALDCFRKGAELDDMHACFAIYEFWTNFSPRDKEEKEAADKERADMLIKAAALGHVKAAALQQSAVSSQRSERNEF